MRSSELLLVASEISDFDCIFILVVFVGEFAFADEEWDCWLVLTSNVVRRVHCSSKEAFRGFRAEYEIIANVWRMMKLRSPGRAVLVGLTENTWDTHRRWLMDSKKFATELEVAQGTRLALMFVVRTESSRSRHGPHQDAMPANDQEHRMIHWVQLLLQPGQQRTISAPASSSSSSSSGKRSAAALSNSQPSDVKALTSKVDKLASTVKLLADRSSSGGRVRDRSRSPRVSKKSSQGKAGKEEGKGGAPKGKGKGTSFEDLVRQHKDKFVLKRDGQEVCFKFQGGICTDQGCVRAHVCAGYGRHVSWKQLQMLEVRLKTNFGTTLCRGTRYTISAKMITVTNKK